MLSTSLGSLDSFVGFWGFVCPGGTFSFGFWYSDLVLVSSASKGYATFGAFCCHSYLPSSRKKISLVFSFSWFPRISQ